MNIQALSSNAPLSKPNQFKYNGKELNEEFDLDWYSYGAREYDPQLGRFFNIDRYSEKYMDFTPYQYGANNPVTFIDINGDSLAIFNAQTREFMEFVDDGKEEWSGATRRYNDDGTAKTNKRGEHKNILTFAFNDPDGVDIQAIKNRTITKIEFHNDNNINGMLNQLGVFKERNQAESLLYAYNEGKGGGNLDYGATMVNTGELKKNTFYITGGNAYNVADYGNYLIGRSFREMGIGLTESRGGAHWNNFWNGRSDITPEYNFGPKTGYGQWKPLDDNADQRAIVRGFASGSRPIRLNPKPDLIRTVKNYYY